MKGNEGYILLESLISLAILLILVSSYVGVTVKMQKESHQRLVNLENYRDLYIETRRCRIHEGSLPGHKSLFPWKMERRQINRGEF